MKATLMNERLADAIRLLPDYLIQHILLCAAALTLGMAFAIPLTVLAVRRRRAGSWVIAATSLIQTVPGLALLALFYPILIGLSRLSETLFGASVPALGFLPSVAALTLYSMLPMVRNGVAAFANLDPEVIDAANAVGMTARQRFFRVEVPLAAPVVMAGIRTAAVWTIGAATLSTSVGQTSLGNYIFSGLQTQDWASVLFGCIAAAALAFLVDQVLGLIEIGLSRRNKKLTYLGLTVFAIAISSAIAWSSEMRSPGYIIGAKNFSEQFILAELMSQRLMSVGATTQLRTDLGSAIAFRALANNEIDAYVDYSGTLWLNVLQRRDLVAGDAMLQELKESLAREYGVLLLGPLGFENAYVLAMRREQAAALHITSVSDLARYARRLTLGADLEFLSRPDWTMIKNAYGLEFAAKREFNPTFMYRAIEDGTVDVISAFSSDGRLAAENLLTLADPLHAIPSYEAVILLSPQRSKDSFLIKALSSLLGHISLEKMREANLMVDRNRNKSTPLRAAEFLAQAIDQSTPQ
jgi:osmoprotectant transport system permease protein